MRAAVSAPADAWRQIAARHDQGVIADGVSIRPRRARWNGIRIDRALCQQAADKAVQTFNVTY